MGVSTYSRVFRLVVSAYETVSTSHTHIRVHADVCVLFRLSIIDLNSTAKLFCCAVEARALFYRSYYIGHVVHAGIYRLCL